MLAASSKDALRKALVGVAVEVQATDIDEVAYDAGELRARESVEHAKGGMVEAKDGCEEGQGAAPREEEGTPPMRQCCAAPQIKNGLCSRPAPCAREHERDGLGRVWTRLEWVCGWQRTRCKGRMGLGAHTRRHRAI